MRVGRAVQRWLFGIDDVGLTVGDLVERYCAFARTYYRHPDGTQTREAENVANALRDLVAHSCELSANDLRPSVLMAVRDRMVARGLSRGVVNQRVGIIRRMYRWAVERELVHPETWHGLRAVRNLQPYRSAARETPPVVAVSLEDVEATKREIHSPQIVAMIDLQLVTGMRPGEVCTLRMAAVSVEGGTWIYRPERHKSSHRGKDRLIPIGPRGREIVEAFLPRAPEHYIFDPREAPRANRAGSGGRYTPRTYRQAITRACDAAGVAPWSPNQLRHTAATRIEELYGLEAAQAVLGHSKPDTTRIYSDAQLEIALRIIREIG